MSKTKNDEKIKSKDEMNLNDRQREVFDYSLSDNKRNLLVSAAAGSGKTRVLVEKIIDMISNPYNKDKTTLDKMLIMTFTVKATYEMKSRIKKALEEKLHNMSLSEELIKESATIQNANITTIDSFCKRVVEEYYTELNKKENSLYKGFDPSYRIADEKELLILYNNILDDFFEKEVYVKDENGNYIYDEFLQSYFRKNSDKRIREMLLKGVNFLSSIAWPLDKLSYWENNKLSNATNNELDKFSIELKNIILSMCEDKDYENNVVDIKSAIEFVLNKKKVEYEKILKDKNGDREKLEKKQKSYEDFKVKADKNIKKIDLIFNLYKLFSDSSFDACDFIIQFLNNKAKVGETLLSNVSSVTLMSTVSGGKANEEKYAKAVDGIKSVFKLFELKDRIIEEEVNVKFINNINENTYIVLLRQFYIRVVEEKIKKNIYSISDYANLALDILYDDDHISVSNFTIKNIKNKYKYIFVDEYQDTNDIQESIISAISSGNNLFMVGDVKQSIYAFRNANPKIFVDKFDLYNDLNKKNGKVITMDINYRSSYNIVGFVNELFEKCMTESFGMIDYKINGMLDVPTKENNSGLSDVEIEKRKNGKEVEVYIVCDKNREDKSKKVKSLVPKMEAEFVAKKIIELHDREGMNYKDIVVLMRNPASRVDFYMDAFCKYNIPCYLEMKKGFFNRAEIRFMVDILNVIDNDRQDIPLANVLTSDIIGITNQELAFIKYAHIMTTANKYASLVDDIDYFYNYMKYLNDDKYVETIKKENFDKKISIDEETEKYLKKNKSKDGFNEREYIKKRKEISKDIDDREPKIIEQVEAFRKLCSERYKDVNGNDVSLIDFDKLGKKLEFYKNVFNELRIKSRYLGISELINEVYSITNIRNIMLSMNDGIMRNANLDALYEFAKDYENTSFVGLFNFMRYIERIKKLDDDKGLAKTSDENDDVVRIMSIHASKGLEFKCVILTGCGSYYNKKDLDRSVPVQFDSELGIATDGYDLEKKYCIETKKKLDIKDKKEKALKEEEMRILYVALTRPKERLIVVGGVHNSGRGAMSYKVASEYYAKIVGEREDNKKVKDIQVDASECNSYLELMLSNYNSDTRHCKLERVEIDIDEPMTKIEDSLSFESIIKDSKKDLEAEKELLSRADGDASILRRLNSDELNKNLNFIYKYSDLQKIDKTKMSVSDIKRDKHELELFEKLRFSEISNIKLSDNSEDAFYRIDKNSETICLNEKLEDKNEKKFAIERGNAYHRYMQFYDYVKNDFIGNIGNGIVEGKCWIDLIDKDRIQVFLKTRVGEEMAEAFKNKELYREHKFMKLFCVDDINEYRKKIGKTPIIINEELLKDHNIIIQGIIDAFYVKRDGNSEYVVLVDYKTDGLSIKEVKEKELEDTLKNEYEIQLDIYADVLEKLTGIEVRNKYIYSFALGRVIEL